MWHTGRMPPQPPIAGGIRARNRAAIEAEILSCARRQLAEVGAAALSLRSIARELGMVSSAIYRYIASRDELLTRLIVSTYTSLADHVDERLADLPDPVGDETERAATRFKAIGRAVRQWALAAPHEYALIYGSPVPDYHAPHERTEPAGTRVVGRLIETLSGVREPPDPRPLPALDPLMNYPPVVESGASAPQVMRGLAAWSMVQGAITSEVFGYLGAGTIADEDAYFEEILQLADQVWRAPA